MALFVRFQKDDTSKSSSAANELGLANVGGVFVVLMGGMGVACVIAVCEFVWKSRKVATEEQRVNMISFPSTNAHDGNNISSLQIY